MFTNALKSFTSNITSNYTLSPAPVSHSGPWKIHDAKKKKTGQAVSVWVFDRKSLDPPGLPLRGSARDGLKAAQDEVVERLKKEAGLLARLRHPCVLELTEPVEETRGGGLMFATEAVMCSLGTLLTEKDEEEARGGSKKRSREVDIDELEIQKGLLQVGKALEFLHESAGLVHGNLTPEAVVINAKSDWKLTSLSFTISSVNPPLPPSFDPRLPPSVQHSLDYSAPDLTIDGTLTPSSDLFSLGLLIVTLHTTPHRSPLTTHNSPTTYRRLISSPTTTPTTHNSFLSTRPLPHGLVPLLGSLLTRHPTGRLTARAFQQSPYFDNLLVSAIRFLDSLPAKTPSEKTAFLKGLLRILPQFPPSTQEKKILPTLLEELRDTSLLASSLPCIFTIAAARPPRLFSDVILPRLSTVFIPAPATKDTSRDPALTALLTHLPTIIAKTTAQELKTSILPIFTLTLDTPTPALQAHGLRTLPSLLPHIDFPTLKHTLFPSLAALFARTPSLAIKISALGALRVCVATNTPGAPVLDKATVEEKVVPLLRGVKTREPAVVMAVVEVVEVVGEVVGVECVVRELIPGVWDMGLAEGLGVGGFERVMGVVGRLGSRVEAEIRRRLVETGVGGGGVEVVGEGGMGGEEEVGEGEWMELVCGKKGGDVGGFGAPAPAAGGVKVVEAPAFSWSTPTPTPNATQRTFSQSPTLHPQPQRSRASTPDVSLGSFAPMTPSSVVSGMGSLGLNGNASNNNSSSSMGMNGGMSMNSTMNMTPVGFGSTTAFRTTPSPAPAQQGGGGIDWSSANKKPSFTTPALTPKTASNYSNGGSFGGSNGFSSTPKPAASNYGGSNGFSSFNTPLTPKPASNSYSNDTHPTILFGQTRQQPAPAASGTGAFAGFMIPPPPPAGMNIVIGTGGKGGGFGGAAKGGNEKKGLDAWESLL